MERAQLTTSSRRLSESKKIVSAERRMCGFLLRAGEIDLHLHRPRLVGGKLERLDRLLDRIRCGQQRTHVDAAIRDQIDSQSKFHAGAECAADLELLRNHRVHRQCRFAAESNQNDRAERPCYIERAKQRARVSRALERHVEVTL